MTRDLQQCGILTSVESYQPVQRPVKLRNSKCCSVKDIQATSKGSDQSAHMRMLVWPLAGRTYTIVGNLMSWLILFWCRLWPILHYFGPMGVYYIFTLYGPWCKKTCLWGLRTTKEQTSLPIGTDWSAPLLFAFWKVSYLYLLQVNFHFTSSSLWFRRLVWVSLFRKPGKQVLLTSALLGSGEIHPNRFTRLSTEIIEIRASKSDCA